MTRSEAFCPRCGATTPEVSQDARPAGDRGLCRTCYLEQYDLIDLPGEVTIDRCSGCRSIREGTDWIDSDDPPEAIAVDILADRIGVHTIADVLEWTATPRRIDADTVQVSCAFEVAVEGGVESVEAECEVTFNPMMCDRCRRIASQDFGSIVQVRAHDRIPDDDEESTARTVTATVLDDRVDAGDRDAYLTDVIERPEGIDFRLSTPRLGQQIATAIKRQMGGEVTTTRTLVTTDSDGQEVYRVTHLVRLPRVRHGDVVAMGDSAGMVVSIDERVGLLDLRTGERHLIDPDTLADMPLVDRDRIVETTLVAQLDERAVQIIDPVSTEAVTVAYYPEVSLEGDTVLTVRVNDDLYLLPNDAK